MSVNLSSNEPESQAVQWRVGWGIIFIKFFSKPRKVVILLKIESQQGSHLASPREENITCNLNAF